MLDGDAIVASTIQPADGTRVVDRQVAAGDGRREDRAMPYTGTDTQGGTEYLVHIDPITNDQNEVIGARWYGIPMSQINGDHQPHDAYAAASGASWRR